jgi:hypothetical protein
MANRAEAVRLMNIDSLADRLVKWLGDLDSNQDSQIQNLESYRWTISQQYENYRLTSYRDG